MARPRKTNLRPAATRFIGRSAELGRLEELIGEGARLVTMFGSAGTGKTRLAEAFAARAQPEFCGPGGGGVWLCELADDRTLEGVCASISRALSIPPSPTTDQEALVRRIGDAIAARGPILIILDNFEQLVDVASETVSAWLGAAPDVRFVVTSREQLRLQSEVRFELPPLQVPEGETSIESADAVLLFVERVRSHDPSFALSPSNAEGVAALVRKLEGIPLAIELAASRVDLLGLQGLLENVDKRIDVLVGGGRDTQQRHSTLRAAIDWSWELLGEDERRALARSAVFRGGFDRDAGEAVLDGSLALVQSLRDKSLLRRLEPRSPDAPPRFRLFETVREFAEEKLTSEERASAQAKHTAYYLDAATRWVKRIGGRDAAQALSALAVERDNLLAVHERALASIGKDPQAPTRAMRCALALDAVASVRGPLASHRELLEETIERTADAELDETLRIRAIRARAKVRSGGAALRDLDAALQSAEAIGDSSLQAEILIDLGIHHHTRREMSTARVLYERALERARAANTRHVEGRVLGNLGALHHDQRRFDEARRFYHDALALLQEVGDERLEASHVANLGVLELEREQSDRALAHFEAAIQILGALGDRRLLAIVVGNVGNLEHERGHPKEARQRYEHALALLREAGDRHSEALCLGRLGRVHAALAWLEEARGCIAAADRLIGRYPDPLAEAAIEIDRGFLEVAEARQATGRNDNELAGSFLQRARDRIDEATRSVDGQLAWTDRSDDIRTAVRLLRRELENVSAAPTVGEVRAQNALVVGPDGKWMQVPEGDPADLRRRKALRLILVKLAEHQREAPGAGLPLEDLLSAGWPGERVVPSAGANRVYVALTTLRKLGLRGHLLSQDDGYLLDPALPVERSEADWTELSL